MYTDAYLSHNKKIKNLTDGSGLTSLGTSLISSFFKQQSFGSQPETGSQSCTETKLETKARGTGTHSY